MTCREFAEFMGDYHSGELPSGVRAEFDRHLSLCVNCRRYLKGYEDTIKLGKRAFDHEEAPVPRDVPEDLVNAILAAKRRA